MNIERVGYIGLGVMGEPMCRHLATKAESVGVSMVTAFDLQPEPLKRVAQCGAIPVASAAEICSTADVVMYCLPDGDKVRELVFGNGELLDASRRGQIVLDLGTTQVGLTREIHRAFADRDVHFMDSPVTRTRQAAQDGKLSTLVGGDQDMFNLVEPLLRCFSTDVTLCGPVGCGQVVKQMNNMVLFQTVVAIAEALSTSRAAGVADDVLFDAMSKGSADSFALRNHGLKSMLSGNFPERAFSTRYALKDLQYALELAAENGLSLSGAQNVREIFEKTIAAGDGDLYFPVLIRSLRSLN
ncbi:MAG: NAD(P)-dependent oxidoreductase [Burkholderiaceae bacterium]